ncbi:class I adenylate-forming enzyme family protein [Methylovulum psychrotolerans]|uniref:Non-ribosomal peptide synthetase n=1 Tax=Methylovulum psychrotolerans TaxID=1704499 RepID=A0A2S5CGW0_9GAMM|nr:class I adenylate-forming enzyme family protein [Methylovulum psychrotolerans]POZ50048.1 non-ribosomal peptide synthetase [Methylovulum psychrotolerans]
MDSAYQLLEAAAQAWPDRPALVDDYGTMRYHELYAQTETLKAQLLQMGISKGLGLAVMGRNGRAFVAAMLAGLGCGAVVVPLSHQLKLAEITQLLQDTGVHAVLDDQTGVMPTGGNSLLIAFSAQTLRFAWTGADTGQAMTPLPDAAFIRYTSGTTGNSKGVVLRHHSILARVEHASKALRLSSEDAVLWVLPMAFHFLVSILVYIRVGAKIIVCKDILASTLLQDADRHRATLLYAAPMHFRLLAADTSGMLMPALKAAISTSSAIPPAIAEAFTRRFRVPVSQAYGIIEAGLPLLDSLTGLPDPHSVGFPTDGFNVAVLDDNGLPIPDGHIGRLAVCGPGLFDAYLKPWQTAGEVMRQGWFLTGDLAVCGGDGRITICGREKAMINVSGNKAFPEEIEAVLSTHPDIVACRAFGQAHPLFGEVVCAEVVLTQQAAWDVEGLLQFCRQRLSTYKVPQYLQRVAQINHTASGKVKR